MVLLVFIQFCSNLSLQLQIPPVCVAYKKRLQYKIGNTKHILMIRTDTLYFLATRTHPAGASCDRAVNSSSVIEQGTISSRRQCMQSEITVSLHWRNLPSRHPLVQGHASWQLNLALKRDLSQTYQQFLNLCTTMHTTCGVGPLALLCSCTKRADMHNADTLSIFYKGQILH